MPTYTYRREDGSTFDTHQKFLDDPLTTCPTTGQKVVRVVQAAGIIFKGSGFYVTDSKGSNPANAKNGKKNGAEGATADTSANTTSPEAKSTDTSTTTAKPAEASSVPA